MKERSSVFDGDSDRYDRRAMETVVLVMSTQRKNQILDAYQALEVLGAPEAHMASARELVSEYLHKHSEIVGEFMSLRYN
jgi:hypothetical protein